MAKDLYEALEVFEPLRGDYVYIDTLLEACLWPSNAWVREALIGARECRHKDFAAQTKEDLKNIASKGFNVKSIEDLHRNVNIKARQNFNGNVPRAGRWHVAHTAGVIEDLGHTQPDPTPEECRAAAKETLNAKSFVPSSPDFSLGEDIFNDLLTTKDLILTYTPGHYFVYVPFIFIYNPAFFETGAELYYRHIYTFIHFLSDEYQVTY